jgi:iron complex outermembrane recepter protein
MAGDVSIYGVRRTVDNPLPFAYIDIERAAGGVRASLERAFTWATLTAGVDAELQRDDRHEYANLAGVRGAERRDQLDGVTSVGPFVQLHAERNALGLTAGARYDALKFESDDRRGVTPDQSGSRTLSAPSGTLGVTWTLPRFTLFGNVASAFQTPTTTELINAPPAPGESCCPAGFNNDLDPQRALSVEGGVRGLLKSWRWEAVAYRMTVKDALLQYQLASVQGRDFYRNAGTTRHQGIELGAGGTLMRNVAVNAAYTYTDVKFVDDGSSANAFEGLRVPGIPLHHLYVGSTLTLDPVRITGEVQHHGAQFGDDANLTRADAYTLFDVRVQTTAAWGRMHLAPFVAFENIFDDAYTASITVNAAGARYFEPGPGRSIMIGAALRTGAWGSR